MDPYWWPLSGFALGGMVNHPQTRQRGALFDKTIGELVVTWLPLIVTGIVAPVVGFLVTEFKEMKTWQSNVAVELTILREHDRQRISDNEAQDRERKLQETVTARRLDIHRQELDTLRARIDDHISRIR